MVDSIFANYITLIKAKPEETQQTFTNLRMNGVQAMEGKRELKISVAGKMKMLL
jgi:hypothetical protein